MQWGIDDARRAQTFPPASPLKITVLAAVEAVLAWPDSLFALRGDGNPVLDRRIPVQIAILDDLADCEKPRVIGQSWLCFVCRAHAAL